MPLIKSLKSQHNKLSAPKEQIRFLEGGVFASGELPTISEKLHESDALPLRPKKLQVLQINLGYMCNQTCKHCHVDAGPDRKEIMDRETMRSIIEVLRNNKIATIDLTGGAPEMNPDFKWFVEQARPFVDELIVRSNLTIILANKRYHALPSFFAKHHVRVVSSLPFYNADKTDRQRGEGVFQKSIDALKMLNKVGYGRPESGLQLDLVYNPSGAFLPAPQASLEVEYSHVLKQEFDIDFNRLLCITNLPISRFLDYLIKTENYEEYMDKLVEAFNPAAIENVMCRDTLSVGWDGRLFDCDFNQMLDLELQSGAPLHIKDFDMKRLSNRNIAVNQHCYGCTAGAGSSCHGTLV